MLNNKKAEGEFGWFWGWFWWMLIISIIISSMVGPSYTHMMRMDMLRDSYEQDYYRNYYSGRATYEEPTLDNCVCNYDLDCEDFETEAEAQACFKFCGPDDIHNLDLDEDGKACEALP